MSAEPFDARVAEVLARASSLNEEGVPYPTDMIRQAIAQAVADGDTSRANALLERAALLVDHTAAQWEPIRELLEKADRLKATAELIGVDTSAFEPDIAGVRVAVKVGPLSGALFETVGQQVGNAVAGLEKAIPAQGSEEARKLSERIQAARRRGEEVGEATQEFDRLLDALRRKDAFEIAGRLSETRRAVGLAAIGPTLTVPTSDEEEEILLEARILARRIHRIKRNARDAQSAARLMSHVRAALSEERRSGTPQDEIDKLWDEVARLTGTRDPNQLPSAEGSGEKTHIATYFGPVPSRNAVLYPGKAGEPIVPAAPEAGPPEEESEPSTKRYPPPVVPVFSTSPAVVAVPPSATDGPGAAASRRRRTGRNA